MYQQNDGLWYFRYKDENGKWRTYSTHTRDESVAMELENHFKLTKDLLRNPKTIEDLISIFSDSKRNPERLDSKITGK